MPVHENLSEDKHVESLLFPCLDEGSTPSSSTDYKIQYISNACKINDFTGICILSKSQFVPFGLSNTQWLE